MAEQENPAGLVPVSPSEGAEPLEGAVEAAPAPEPTAAEQLESTVSELLKESKWTRAGIAGFTKTNIDELKAIVDKCKAENCKDEIKEICDEQLVHTRDSIVALYLSGMISVCERSIDMSAISSLFDILEKNHKEALVEPLCESILEEDENNTLALRKLAACYKDARDERVWDLYERIVKLDYEEADMARALAEHYESLNDRKDAVSYYKKALARYVNAGNLSAAKAVWTVLIPYIPGELDFFLTAQKKLAKTVSPEKSVALLRDLYTRYRGEGDLDTAISLLKMMLEINKRDTSARKEIADCYRARYAENPHIEEYIQSSDLTQSYRDVFEAISDFEKHVAFDAKRFVYHRTWGVGRISSADGDMLTINFGRRAGVRKMSLKMAVSALTPLPQDHIWVYEKTVPREELAGRVKEDPAWALKTIIKSFGNKCDYKRIKEEIAGPRQSGVPLPPPILKPDEWQAWHARAQKILKEDVMFGVDSDNAKVYTVRDRPRKMTERLADEFRANKDFFARIDITARYLSELGAESDGDADDQFTELRSYFENYLKSFTTPGKETVASFLLLEDVNRRFPALAVTLPCTFEELYEKIPDPAALYDELRDTKNTNLKKRFLEDVAALPDWQDEYVKLFPTVCDKDLVERLIEAGAHDAVVRLVQNCFGDWRANRTAVNYLISDCSGEDWFRDAGVSEERQLVTLINICAACYKEISNHVNTTENKKIAKAAENLLFARKTAAPKKSAEAPDANALVPAEEGSADAADESKAKGKSKNRAKTRNALLDYMLSSSEETVARLYTQVFDVKGMDPSHVQALRNGIITKYPDFKFPQAAVRAAAPRGLLVTAASLADRRARADDIERNQLPRIADEVAEAREKGDLSENAEYQAAREAQHRLNAQLTRLRGELARAVVFDPTTATSSFVSFGTRVTLLDNLNGTDVVYTIMGPWESNAEEGVISYLSPLGAALLDMKAGETKRFTINDREYDYTVKAIEPASLE